MPEDNAPGRKLGFEPVVDRRTRVLLLGSLPGESSLAAQRYYAHPANRFWHLVGKAIGEDLATLDYEARLGLLLARGIGLWDTVDSAHRSGSLDSAIRAARPTDLSGLAVTLPALRMIGFNGAKSAALGRKAIGTTDIALVDLPSSSPAYAAMPLAEKEKRWAVIADHL